MERKKIVKLIKAIGDQLPFVKDKSDQTYSVKGCDIELSGLSVPEDMDIDLEKEYYFNDGAYVESNHGRRLLRAYDRSGKKGMINYIMIYVKDGRQKDLKKIIEKLPI